MDHGQINARDTLRATIEYMCRLLASYDIQLTAETLRQAKFDGDAVRHQTAWQGSMAHAGRC